MINQPEHDSDRKVTLEELLRLKRAERPAPEFWGRFEQDLRAKQLAAIVEPRPWWISMRLPQATRALARFQIPMGAAAVLALTFVVVREYRPATLSDEIPVSVPVINVTNAIDTSVDTVAAVEQPLADTQGVSVTVAVSSAPSKHTASVADMLAEEPSAVGSGGLMAMIPWAAPQQVAVADVSSPPVTLGELPQVHFASAMNPGREHNFEGRVEVEPVAVSAVSDVAEPVAVAQVSPVSPREVRRNRILSSLVVADNNSDAERSRSGQGREVLTSSLDDDRLYDSVRRLGMVGDRLTLKF
ncbi:hypothetical protein [Rariglobus hedericola]|uniref:Uncharacterized protein n=1 Tax=Rariglobus hedericola TaxID=2597822 RepID=A0A556QRF0_9BACT|nr:hypothetical protein [Rariglobus hedericola]TSJ79216.1 hypothetical protein FPL22_07960 [Rariglobus hedericola]